jgi:hypothetical protein
MQTKANNLSAPEGNHGREAVGGSLRAGETLQALIIS